LGYFKFSPQLIVFRLLNISTTLYRQNHNNEDYGNTHGLGKA
jgi:hypothetical protein